MAVKTCIINLKNRLLFDEAKKYEKVLSKYDGKYNLIVAPGNYFLPIFQSKNYSLCAQDISSYDFLCTGEETGKILKSLGCDYVIIGHAERRRFYDDEYTIEKKIKNAIKNNLKVIYCVGEQRKNTKLFLKEIVKGQIKNMVESVGKDNIDKLIIAYEPVWSIGSNITPTYEEIFNVIGVIKDFVLKKYNYSIKVFYGGSIDKDNIDDIAKIENVDGIVMSSSVRDSKRLMSMLK